MRQLILHIGMHKTGTTSIQRSLEGLALDRVKYVNLGSSNHSGPMSVAFADSGAKSRRMTALASSPESAEALKVEMRARLENELAQKQFDKFVISGEGMVFLSPKSLRGLQDFVRYHVDEVRVFAYVRDPVGFSSSALQQRIKGGYAGHALIRAGYRAKFSPFIEVFGRENFSVKEFSRPTLKDGSVVSDFCELWGVPFDPKREVRSNESLAEPTVKLMHLFNRMGTPSLDSRPQKEARTVMVEAMGAHFKSKFDLPLQFHPGAIDREDLGWLQKEFGVAFPVDPSMGRTMPMQQFKDYLEDVPAEFVLSYRQLLAQRGIPVKESDAPVDLLNKHFLACLADVQRPPKPVAVKGKARSALRNYVKLASRWLVAGLKGLRP